MNKIFKVQKNKNWNGKENLMIIMKTKIRKIIGEKL
jgi:hypothetical protein